jgi:hypothetical protein
MQSNNLFAAVNAVAIIAMIILMIAIPGRRPGNRFVQLRLHCKRMRAGFEFDPPL